MRPLPERSSSSRPLGSAVWLALRTPSEVQLPGQRSALPPIYRVCSRVFVDLTNDWMVNSDFGPFVGPDVQPAQPALVQGEATNRRRASGAFNAERSTRVRKQDLIREVANEASLSEAQATKAVNAFLDAIHNSLANNTEVQISGFGSFKVV